MGLPSSQDRINQSHTLSCSPSKHWQLFFITTLTLLGCHFAVLKHLAAAQSCPMLVLETPHRCILHLCKSRVFVPSSQVAQMCAVTCPCPACCHEHPALEHHPAGMLSCAKTTGVATQPLAVPCYRQLLFGDILVSPEQHWVCTVSSLP